MSRRPFAFLAAAAVVAAFAAGRAFSEDPPAGGPPGGMSPEAMEMMKEWEQLKTPGAPHQALKLFVGAWTGKGSWTDAGMTVPFTETFNGKMVHGDRFLQIDATSTMPGMDPMVSQMFMGYDNGRQKYVHAMLGDMTTAIGFSEGTYDAASKTFTMEGVSVMAPGKERKHRTILKIASNDEWTIEMWFEPRGGGEMTQSGSATYTRKK